MAFDTILQGLMLLAGLVAPSQIMINLVAIKNYEKICIKTVLINSFILAGFSFLWFLFIIIFNASSVLTPILGALMLLTGIIAAAQITISIMAIKDYNKSKVKTALITSFILSGIALIWFLLVALTMGLLR